MTTTADSTTTPSLLALHLPDDLETAAVLPEDLIARVTKEFPLECEVDAKWSVSEVSDVQDVLNAASNAGVSWAHRIVIWDLSDDDSESFLMTLNLDREARRRIAGLCTDLRKVIRTDVEDQDAAETVREVLTYLRDEAARLQTNFATPDTSAG